VRQHPHLGTLLKLRREIALQEEKYFSLWWTKNRLCNKQQCGNKPKTLQLDATQGPSWAQNALQTLVELAFAKLLKDNLPPQHSSAEITYSLKYSPALHLENEDIL
jgi:hypothetical protein